jgi:hypothetical protein
LNGNGSINGSRFGALMDDHEQAANEDSNHDENTTVTNMDRQVAEKRENEKGKKSKNDDTLLLIIRGAWKRE